MYASALPTREGPNDVRQSLVRSVTEMLTFRVTHLSKHARNIGGSSDEEPTSCAPHAQFADLGDTTCG